MFTDVKIDEQQKPDDTEAELRPIKVRPVLLISSGIPQYDPEREERGEIPRGMLFNRTLRTTLINEDYLSHTPPWWRRTLYKLVPAFIAQITETFIIKKKFDVVVSWSDKNALLFALLLKLTRSKFPHVAMMYWPSGSKKEPLLKMVHPYISTLCLWTSTHRDLAINKLGIPEEKIRMIPQFVDTKFYRPMPGETDTICAVGQEMRDYPTLIEALRGTDIKCHLATGSSPGSRKVYDTVKVVYNSDTSLPPNVTAGALSHAKLRELYARSRFVVVPLLPTDSDQGTHAITEAMAMGKGVMCSLTRGQRDVIEEGKTGIYVPQGDPKALREAIEYWWEHPEIPNQMGREGRKFVEENLTLENFVETVRDIVEDTVSKFRATGNHGKK